jgi:hypothetical protein
MPHWTDELLFRSHNSAARTRPKAEDSPYYGVAEDDCVEVTRGLLRAHPLDADTLVQASLASWDAIFASNIGGLEIGSDIQPTPQVMGNFLHELIPRTIGNAIPQWRRDASAAEKDLVYVPDPEYSIEIKTSSHPEQVFGNRSVGIDPEPPREGSRTRVAKKAKSGYYLTVNFERWVDAGRYRPEVTLVRFGWLDGTDWVAQSAGTGQNSTLPSRIYGTQLPVIFRRE